jgi:flagellar biosynthesis chaperone FliJ
VDEKIIEELEKRLQETKKENEKLKASLENVDKDLMEKNIRIEV